MRTGPSLGASHSPRVQVSRKPAVYNADCSSDRLLTTDGRISIRCLLYQVGKRHISGIIFFFLPKHLP